MCFSAERHPSLGLVGNFLLQCPCESESTICQIFCVSFDKEDNQTLPRGSFTDLIRIHFPSLFTSPSVSFAYERGWRQGFASAGFPGPDKEAELAMEYFAPAVAKAKGSSVLVDMSCATGKLG